MDELLNLITRDFDGLVLQLVRYARKIMRDKFWRGEYLLDCDPGKFVFPGGGSVEDLVLSVLEKALAETRTWDASRFPELIPVLKGMIKSEIDNAMNLEENKTTTVLSSSDGDDGINLDFETNADAHQSELDGSTRLLPDGFKAHPGTASPANEYSDELHREVENDPELSAVVLAIRYGAEKAQEIADVTGIPVKRVYELNRKLDAIADKITRRVALRRLVKDRADLGGQ